MRPTSCTKTHSVVGGEAKEEKLGEKARDEKFLLAAENAALEKKNQTSKKCRKEETLKAERTEQRASRGKIISSTTATRSSSEPKAREMTPRTSLAKIVKGRP